MKKIIYLILALGFVGTLSAQYACPTCTINVTMNNQTVNGTAGVDVICVTADVTNTTFNNLNTGDIVCVSPGVTWTMPSDLNYNGLVTYRIGPGANVTLPGGGSNGNLQIDNYGNLTFTNAFGSVSFIANGGSEMLINNYEGAVLDALGVSNVTFGGGSDFNNYGTMNFNNLETAESDSPLNDGTGIINVKRAFYLHSFGFTNLGTINTTCEDTGNPAWNTFWISQAINGCGLTVGDKGPFQAEFGPLSCTVVEGATVFNGPAMINGYYETSGDLTIRKVVSGSGNIVVSNGTSGTENDGALLGGINFYDVNTVNGFGNTPAIMAANGLDFNNGNPVDNFSIPAVQPTNPCLGAACVFTTSSTTPECHANGTPEDGADDYMTFSINVANSLEGSLTYTVTATQGGNPIVVTLANGLPADAVNCNLDTPLRTPAGTAGGGDIVLTITDNVHGCTTTINIVDPGTCAVTCVPGTPSTVMYSYATQIQTTELVNVPIILPQFDDQGGTRTLTGVTLEYGTGGYFSVASENSAVQSQNFIVTSSTDSEIQLNGNTLASVSLSATSGLQTLPAGILVPAQGTWPGDVSNRTLETMRDWAQDLMLNGKDPRLDSRWVSNATGDPGTDDDIYFMPVVQDEETGMVTYTTPVDLVPFQGTGSVPLEVNTLSGFGVSGGGGNISSVQATRGYAFAKVTYTYECAAAPVCVFTTSSTTPECHANGTPEDGADDYITFSINVANSLEGSLTYTVTATQGGNPIVVTLANGLPADAVNCNLDTPLRTPAGTAGGGDIVLTITDNVHGCTTTINIVDPGTCAVTCVPGTPSTVMYSYRTQFDVTELSNLPLIIPQFDEQGGTRTLTSVQMDYEVGFTTNAILENSAANPQNFEADFTCRSRIRLDGTNIITENMLIPFPLTMFPAGVVVPAQGTWPGDDMSGITPSTIGAMPWVNDYFANFKNPLADPRWVTTATGNPTHDDDMVYFPPISATGTGSVTYNLPGDLVPFIGAGSVPLVTSTLTGQSSSGGGGNILVVQRTRAYADVKVTYTYECAAACVAPTAITLNATPATCTGATENNDGTITLTAATNATHYGVSLGATYTGPTTIAGATAFDAGTDLPLDIITNAPNAGATYVVRIFNAADDCFVDETVVVAAATCVGANACNCEYYMYLNDVQGSGSGNGFVHKFRINSDGTFTEIFSNPPTNTIPWFPTGGGLPSPHGLAQDLNGDIYIGEGPFGTGSTDIRKLSCSGTLVPESTFKIDDGGYNFSSRDGIIYVNSAAASNRINAYRICDGSLIGWISLADVNNVDGTPQSNPGSPANEDWGFSIAPDGTFYATSGIGDYSGSGKTDRIFRFTPTLADFTAHTVYSAFITSATYPAGITANNHETFGITSDPAGNMYVVVSDFSTSTRWILKFNSSGTLVASISEANSTPTGGFEGGRGLAYHEPTDKLYVAGGTDGDCVAIIDPSNLAYEGPALANVPGQFPKGLAIVKECCPGTTPVTVNETACFSTAGEQFFLADFTGDCDAPLCAGGNAWTPDPGNSANLVFNVCDNSVTVNGAGCGTFTLTNPGVGNACGAFSFTVNLCFTSSPTATFTQTAPTCTGATANNDGTITLTAATTATHYGVSLGATYTGPTTIAGATAFDAGADLPLDIITNAPNAGATYVVRIFNGADDCFVDETVVVAAVTCVAPVCDLGITTSAVCQVGETGKYDLTVTLNYTNSPGGTITVTLGTGETATSAATTASSNGSLMVTFTDLVNTGAANVTVDAAFNAAACSAPQATYTAPTDCCPAPLPLCPGESYTLTAETGWVNYQWFFDDGMGGGPVAIPTATNEIYATADQLGTYTWTAEDAMGCPVQTCCPIVLEAGVCAIYAIGSTVFADLNNSGTQDGTEVGVPNVPVQLWRVVGTKDLTPGSEDDVQVGTNITTNPQGNYLFADLPAGEYYVVIPDVAFAGALVDLSSSSTDIATTNADNGIDGDDNGIQMDGDGGFVMSPVIELGDAAGEPTGAAESFTGGTQDDAADDAAGDMTVDFGFFAPVAVCSEIFVDNNNNGIRDPGEPAIPSITLSVYTTGANGTAENGGGDDVLAGSDSSDPTTGEVAVNDLLPGVPYYLRVDMSGATRYNLSFPLNSSWTESPADSDIYYSGVQTARSTGNKNQCNPISGTFPRPGFFEPVAVGDYTWIDINEDGQQAGEPVLQGVLVTLYDATTNMPVTMDVDGNAVVPQETDVNGEYLFENLAPGSYYVVFDKDGGSVANPELYSLTLQDQGQDATDSDANPATGQSSATPFLESNEEDLTLDAGYRCAVDAEAGTGQTICSTAIVDLTTLGASITPATLGGTWATTGSGTFDGGGVFGTATTYTPSTADVLAGQVILTLTTNDPAALGSACPPVTDDVLIIILKVGCGTFPWSGN